MKYLIVNADDFGASPGINRGILEAHQFGIVTSTSLMVNSPFAGEAAKLAAGEPRLSVGLHVDLGDKLSAADTSLDWLGSALWQQLARFEELMGRRPTHLDSHHNVHRDPRVLPQFVALATELGLPLRDHWPVHHCSRFYGQWNGESHPEQISAENLLHILEMEMSEGVTELSCHPGYVDAGFTTSYSAEREAELRTLCDAALRRALAARGIHLANYHHLEQLLPRAAAA